MANLKCAGSYKIYIKRVFKNFLFLFIFFIIIISIFVLIIQTTSSTLHAKKEITNNNGTISKALFAPDNPIQKVLINLIENEQESIKVATYTFTDKDISKSLIQAYKNGITIEIVSDRSYASYKSSKIPYLANHKIPIWIYQPESPKDYALMHNKFLIFKKNLDNKSILATGSYNLTKAASQYNQENMIFLEDTEIISSFENCFEILKTRSLAISGEPSKINCEVNRKEISTIYKIRDFLASLLQIPLSSR